MATTRPSAARTLQRRQHALEVAAAAMARRARVHLLQVPGQCAGAPPRVLTCRVRWPSFFSLTEGDEHTHMIVFQERTNAERVRECLDLSKPVRTALVASVTTASHTDAMAAPGTRTHAARAWIPVLTNTGGAKGMMAQSLDILDTQLDGVLSKAAVWGVGVLLLDGGPALMTDEVDAAEQAPDWRTAWGCWGQQNRRGQLGDLYFPYGTAMDMRGCLSGAFSAEHALNLTQRLVL